MSRMENDAREFLVRVVRTLIAALMWMIINVFFGIYMGWMFFFSRPTAGNYIFYAWMIASLLVLLWYFRLLWKRPLPSDNHSGE